MATQSFLCVRNHFLADWFPLAATEGLSVEEALCWSSSSSSHISLTLISLIWREAPNDVMPACDAPLFVPACSPIKPWPARNCSLVNFGRFFFWPPMAPVSLACKGKSPILFYSSKRDLMMFMWLRYDVFIAWVKLQQHNKLLFVPHSTLQSSRNIPCSNGHRTIWHIEQRLIDAIYTVYEFYYNLIIVIHTFTASV